MRKAFSDPEFEQSIIRLLLGGLVQLYFFLVVLYDPWLNLGFLTFYLFAVSLTLSIFSFPGDYWWRKIAGQCIDLGSVSILLYVSGEDAVAIIGVYLWVIIGNGCRFGVQYLLSATIITTVFFSVVAFNEPFWVTHKILALGVGITHLLVPVYFAVLLRRLTLAKNRLEQLSLSDELTGMMNRRAFQNQLSAEFTRLKRLPAPFSLMLLDIDHFKMVNDTYGHPAGDAVLQTVAKTLQEACRDIDFIARIGGEEFAILLPGHNLGQQSITAQRLREAVKEASTPIKDQTVRVTISIGVAPWTNRFKDKEEWVQTADQALYQAKEGGRDNVVCT